MFSVQSIVYRMYIVRSKVYSVQCAVFGVQCSVYSVQCTVMYLTKVADRHPNGHTSCQPFGGQSVHALAPLGDGIKKKKFNQYKNTTKNKNLLCPLNAG